MCKKVFKVFEKVKNKNNDRIVRGKSADHIFICYPFAVFADHIS